MLQDQLMLQVNVAEVVSGLTEKTSVVTTADMKLMLLIMLVLLMKIVLLIIVLLLKT